MRFALAASFALPSFLFVAMADEKHRKLASDVKYLRNSERKTVAREEERKAN